MVFMVLSRLAHRESGNRNACQLLLRQYAPLLFWRRLIAGAIICCGILIKKSPLDKSTATDIGEPIGIITMVSLCLAISVVQSEQRSGKEGTASWETEPI